MLSAPAPFHQPGVFIPCLGFLLSGVGLSSWDEVQGSLALTQDSDLSVFPTPRVPVLVLISPFMLYFVLALSFSILLFVPLLWPVSSLSYLH